LSIQWIGDTKDLHGNAQLNRHITKALSQMGHTVFVSHNEQNVGAEFTVHHDLMANFSNLGSPANPKTVAFRTWDFGPYPPRWVEKINKEYKQLWVYSDWIRHLALRGGVDADKVHRIPLGIQSEIFQPSTSRPTPSGRRPFQFLFIGAAVQRKGLDILLSAYQAAFSPQDNVRLVIKDLLNVPFYKNSYEHDAIRNFGGRPENPELLYVDTFLEPVQLAELIRSCHFGVYPYRAEGFAAPPLELMACGVPCILPRFGPCLDYASDGNTIFVEYTDINIPINKRFVYNSLGFEEFVTEVHFCEVKVADLAAKMRMAYEMNDGDYQALSKNAAKSAARFTWLNTAMEVTMCLSKIS
jgi:glycosyltransferase involved in cell wall biosynthesis